MRLFFHVFLFSIVLFGCSKDTLPGCTGTGEEGAVCKEYQYVFGNYNGLNEYQYDDTGAQLIKKTTKTSSGKEEGSISYSYTSSGDVSMVVQRSSNSEILQTKEFNYSLAGDLIEEKTSGSVSSSKIFTYENSLLIAVDRYEDGVLKETDSLEYFTGTTNLYRTLTYKAQSIHQITYSEWFGDEIRKEVVFDNEGVKQESKVERYENGNLIEELFYSAAGSLISDVSYVYVGNLLQEVVKKDETGKVFEQLIYQRF